MSKYYDVACPNFEVCDGVMDPQLRTCSNCTWRSLDNKNKRLLKFDDGQDCPICLDENVRCVKNINCDHYRCIGCFKTCHELANEDNPPPFPSSVCDEEDYDNDPEKYDDNPIIQVWRDCCAVYYSEIDKINYERKNLRVCPLCRQ
jgi:hypothetical protein